MFFYGMVGYAPASYISVLELPFCIESQEYHLWSPTHLGWLISRGYSTLHVQSIVIFLPPILLSLIQRNVFHVIY